jgi:hypothetical protein
MLLRQAAMAPVSRITSLCAMREELGHCIREALFELDLLPDNEDGQIVGIYAIMDDIERAMTRVQGMDPDRKAPRAPLPVLPNPGRGPVLRVRRDEEPSNRLGEEMLQS